GVKLAQSWGFGIEVRIGALQPGRTLVGLEIHVWQDTPDTGAAEGIGVQSVKQRGHDCIKCPAGDGAILVLWQLAGHRDDLDTRRGSDRAWTPWGYGILQA